MAASPMVAAALPRDAAPLGPGNAHDAPSAYHSGPMHAATTGNTPARAPGNPWTFQHYLRHGYFDSLPIVSHEKPSAPVSADKQLPATPSSECSSFEGTPSSTPTSSGSERFPCCGTAEPSSLATTCFSPSATSETEVLLSPPLLSTTSATPQHSPRRSLFHLKSADNMRAKRPSLLRTTSAYLEPASATFPLETSHKQAEALELASHVIKRSQSLPPWLSRESDDFPAKQVPLLARRLSDVALDIRPAGRRARTSETRYRALSEVVDTEAAYLQDLIVLKDVYFNALNFTSLHPSDKASIFRNIEELYAWHRSVHEAFTSIDEELKWRVSDGAAAEGKWDNSKVLAAIERVLDVFTEKAGGLQLYEVFCARHGDALNLLKQHQRNKSRWDDYTELCRTVLNVRFPDACQSRKLDLWDYLIKPVQRICRYPLMISSLASFLDAAVPEEALAARKAYNALRTVRGAAAAVDSAKALLITQRRTENVASRMEMPNTTRTAFLGILGQVTLAGPLLFMEIPTYSDINIKARYFGCFLYESHLVVVKVKRDDCYEPIHWFPLRAFDIEPLADSDGLLPYSFLLKHAQYQYQLAATCSQERDIWINKLQETASQRRQCWLDAICHNPVAQPYDDVSISSVTIQPEHIPSSTARPNTDAIQASSARAPPRANLSSSSLNSLSGRGLFNFNQTASALLGKGSKQTLDLIDLRLAEVFSDVLLTARSKGDEENTLFIGDRSHMRARSDPKHSNVQPPSQVSRRATTRDIQRQKSMILEHSVPQLHKASASQTIRLHGRRPSADAALSEPSFHERSDSAPVLLQRSKTNPSKPRSTCESKTMQVWTGNLRQRTSSWMGSQLSARHLLDQQVTVARNDSSSSSGSSRDMIQTPSPMSSTPPSPLIQPIEGTSFPDNVLPSRKSSFSSSTTAFGSPEQDLQALRASEYLYDSAGSQSKAGWMSSFRKRSAPPTLTRHGRSRSHSNSSLLGLFTPALSPTVASPLDEEASAPNSSPPSSASAVSVSEVQLADIALSSTASPVTLSPPPAKSPLRRSKSKRLSSLFPLTRMQSTTNASQTSLTSPS